MRRTPHPDSRSSKKSATVLAIRRSFHSPIGGAVCASNRLPAGRGATPALGMPAYGLRGGEDLRRYAGIPSGSSGGLVRDVLDELAQARGRAEQQPGATA